MKHTICGFTIILSLLFGFSDSVQGQSADEELNIFGFSQVMLNHKYLSSTIKPSSSIPTAYTNESYSLSFALHQVNLFFQKPVNEQTTFFLNVEATGSYSTKIPSGQFEIPEGWIAFKLADNLEVKAGLLLPKFNNLLEIKNRLPLFPYIVRPLMYETLVSSLFEPEDYKPNNAYFQLYGFRGLSDNLNFDYAFFIGNAEESFFSTIPAGSLGEEEENTALYQGENLNTQLLYGGRIGIENNFKTFKFGTSFTYDEDNRTKVVSSLFRVPGLQTPILGEVPRFRLGFDLSFTYQKFSFEGEFIGVYHNHKEIREIAVFREVSLNKYFHYSNLTYNFSDNLFVFGFYTYNEDNTYEVFAPNSPSKAGIVAFSGGGGWRINDVTLFKMQFLQSNSRENDYLDYKLRLVTFGISTIF